MAERVEDGKVVLVHYKMEAGGAVVESTFGGAPTAWLKGANQVFAGLEAALLGKEVGETFEAEIPATEAFGERKGKGPVAVPRKELPKTQAPLQRGMPLTVEDSAGNPVRVWVSRVQGAQVWIDLDHPLAGQDLKFTVQVLAMRDPLPEEIAHGHAHGPSGHHHH